MKNSLFALALCAGMLSAGAALADRWVTPINGNLSAVTLSDGDVMMKVQLPAKEFAAISRLMAAKNNTCTLYHMTQGGLPASMILVCGATREYIPNY